MGARHLNRLGIGLVAFTLGILPVTAMAHDDASGTRKGGFVERMFQRIDQDQSGSISLEEGRRAGTEMIQRVDGSGDGLLSRDEFLAPRAKRTRSAERLAQIERRRSQRFAKLDTDRDGRVSLQEFLTPAAEKFQAADSDRDGQVTRQELQAAWKHRRQQPQAR